MHSQNTARASIKTTMNNNKVWFVTGASQGLGLALVQHLLADGYRVAGTSRNAAALQDAVGSSTPDRFLPLEMHVTDEASVRSAIAATIAHFGGLDAVVNNAGYGQLGTLEESTDREARENYDVNVFGTLNVIRAAMPHLRAQGSGHIFNIASVGGYVGNFEGWGIYCSTKFAVAGLTEALAVEVQAFGVRATVVYPGYFRTNFLTKESLRLPANAMPEYEGARAIEAAHVSDINGNQPNDPEKAADALIEVFESSAPPVHLFLGDDAYGMAGTKIGVIQSELEGWKDLTVSMALEEEAAV